MERGKIAIFLLICICFLCCAAKPPPTPITNIPTSKEGTIEDYTNPAEILVYASGIGSDTDSAILDARRAAVYVILIGGTDPLIQTREEKDRFMPHQENFFEASQIRNFISWEGTAIRSRLKMTNGALKIGKHFKVNKTQVDGWLIANRIKAKRDDLVGVPIMMMVIPQVKAGENPVEAMQSDPNLKHAGAVIRSYLTNLQYDVQVPEQMEVIQTLGEAQESLKGMELDYSYQFALAIGSDVYITYTVDVQNRAFGGRTVRKAITAVKAFETTTGRQLGEETGYSEERPSAEAVVIEEAIHGAIDKVLSRINAYWKQDLERGVQYKLIIRIEEGIFDEDEAEDIAFAISDLLDALCNLSKEVVATDTTLDYLVWANPDTHSKSRDLYRDLRKQFPKVFARGKISRISLTRKLITLKVTEAD